MALTQEHAAAWLRDIKCWEEIDRARVLHRYQPKPVNAALFDLKGYDYKWAVSQLAAGRRVRRKSWPMEWVSKGDTVRRQNGDSWKAGRTYLRVAHVFMSGEAPIFGFGGVIGADFADTICGHYDSGCFYPKADDVLAEDWELSHPAQDGG